MKILLPRYVTQTQNKGTVTSHFSVKTSADQQQQLQTGGNTDPTKCLLLLVIVCEVAFKGKITPHRQTIPRLHYYATSLKDTNRCHCFHDVCAVNSHQ